MEIIEAKNHRDDVIALLKAEKLPVDDLPESLDDFLVAWVENQIAGTIGLETYDHYSLLRSLAVKQGFRNVGIAGELVNAAEKLAATKGLKAIFLLTETADKYFDRKQYRRITRDDVPAEVQQSSEYSSVCPQSAVVMKKIL